MPRNSSGKKQTTGHYYNNIYYSNQPNRFFIPGTKVIEKKTGYKYTVLQKYEKSPRSLIRVKNDNNGVVKYIYSKLLHTDDYSKEMVNKNLGKCKDKGGGEGRVRKKRPFVKNTKIGEFRENKRDFNEQLSSYNSITKCGGGVSINYTNNDKGEFYIHRLSGNKMIDDFNSKNLEVMNYRYNILNNYAKMKTTDHIIPRSRILDIFMKDSSGSTNNLVPDCCSKSDFYTIVNKYINENNII